MTGKQKFILIALVALVATVLGRLFLNAPISHISFAAETVGNDIFGWWNITNSLISAWVAMAVIVLLAVLATRKMALVPRGMQNLVEASLEWLLGLVEGIAGKEHGRRFFPLVATIFLFILIGNWLSLLPIFGTIGKVDSAEFVLTEELGEVLGDLKEDFPALESELVAYEAVLEEHEETHGRDAAPPRPPEAIFQQVVRVLDAEAGDDRLAIFDGSGSLLMIPIGYKKVKEIRLNEYWDFNAWRPRAEITGGVVVSDESEVDLEGKTVGILLPYFRSMNTDIMNPLAIALIAMFMVEFWGIRANGFFSYVGRFANFKQGPIGVFVGGLEAISEFAKVISFTVRLLGNMFAGEVLIFSMVFLLPVLAGVFVFPFLLEVFVGFIQAVIFAVLTVVFATIAVTSHNGQAEEEGVSGH
ncbi:MAG: F0F1 ATP synthase subunit A [Chloroflexi bacterium]|nr:F0F1 ATP synthase subunit A [Chloroflexota bacterium]MCH8195127.1 F0F1 ATP synthase subunit A [Chloroflexota bacterium]MCH8283307.1 F0F1 ATP synthase subunit A [Chloroflexota bacterium]MCI0768864.1 F0F1 ATP synthase subunit A [Chloroflexota bacterium]